MITPESIRPPIRTEHIDPVLASFWEGFPCPPPWRSGLLTQLNFTSCLGSSTGNAIKLLMLRRCGAEMDDVSNATTHSILRGNDGSSFSMESCALNCKLLIVSACIVLFTCILSGIIYLLYRNHLSKTSNGGLHGNISRLDTHKVFNSCHYASAPVIGRLNETSFCQGKELYLHARQTPTATPNRYDKLRFTSDKRSQIYPGVADKRMKSYENDLETSNDYESIDDLDTCESKPSSPWRFGRHYNFDQGETILSISSDLDTDDNLCQVSTDNLQSEHSFSSVACNKGFELEVSGDDASHDCLEDVNFDIHESNLTARDREFIPTFTTFNKDVANS